MQPVYKRILLKLSGEVLAGPQGHGIDFDTVQNICKAVKECSDMGVEIGLVVGGGNFWRGPLRSLYHVKQAKKLI